MARGNDQRNRRDGWGCYYTHDGKKEERGGINGRARKRAKAGIATIRIRSVLAMAHRQAFQTIDKKEV